MIIERIHNRPRDEFQRMLRYQVTQENGLGGHTESRFFPRAHKTTESRARAPKRHGACDRPRSTAPWLFRSGARAFTTKLIHNHNHPAASFNDTMTTPYFRCQVVRRMGSTSQRIRSLPEVPSLQCFETLMFSMVLNMYSILCIKDKGVASTY